MDRTGEWKFCAQRNIQTSPSYLCSNNPFSVLRQSHSLAPELNSCKGFSQQAKRGVTSVIYPLRLQKFRTAFLTLTLFALVTS